MARNAQKMAAAKNCAALWTRVDAARIERDAAYRALQSAEARPRRSRVKARGLFITRRALARELEEEAIAATLAVSAES